MDSVASFSNVEPGPRVAGRGVIPTTAKAVLLPPRPLEGMRVKVLTFMFALDICCIASGFIVGGAIRLGSPVNGQTFESLAIVIPIFILVALNNRSYSLQTLESPWIGIKRSGKALLYACAVAISLLFYMKWSEQFSRAIFAIGTVSAFGAMVGTRWLFGIMIGNRQSWTFRNRLVIVDHVKVARQPGDCIVLADQLGITPGADDPVERHRLGEIVELFDCVVIACAPAQRKHWAHTLGGLAVDVEVMMPELAEIGAVAMRRRPGETTLVTSSRPLSLNDQILKRSMDLVIASLALLIAAPVMMIIAIAVKLETRGPIFFRQQRVGQNNLMFEVLKFRTMHADASDSAGERSTSRSDGRVTRVGRFLRRTSLDELPQLINVLSGEMSLVGPRPHALGSTAEDSLFWQIDRRYFERHSIKPGITGLAQVRGFRGATARRNDLTNRLQADLEYVTGWTVWRDLKILARTCIVLTHRNAF